MFEQLERSGTSTLNPSSLDQVELGLYSTVYHSGAGRQHHVLVRLIVVIVKRRLEA